VIDQVLVAERDAENALAQKMDERVLDMIGTAVVDEATRQPFAEPDPLVGCRQKHCAAIRGNGTTVESAHKFAPARPSQLKLGLDTLCRHRGAPPHQIKSFSQNNFL
jgi:hypothetical protein